MKKITLALCVLFSQLIFAQDGVLDTSFGTNGYVLLNTDNGVTLDRQIQPNGTTFYIENGKFRRLTANGTLDTTFGIAGAITIVQPGANYESFTVANNQITLITKGTYDNYTMGRYNFDGTVDATLGTAGQGYVSLNVGSDIKGHIISAESPDGKIFIGGNSSTAYGSYNNYYIRRHNTDGTNDSNYNFNAYSLGINISQTSIGYYTEEFTGGLKVRPDGNAVIFGYSAYYESSSSFVSNRRATGAIVAPTGQPIKLQHSYEAYYGLKYDLAFDQDNNTYMLGGQTNYGSTAAPTASIKKFTAAGNTAMSFGTSGTLAVSLDIDATTKADFRKILIQPDGKILLAGMAVKTTTLSDYPYLVIARYLTNGTLDTTFGTNGYILHDIEHPNTPANRNNLTQFYASADYSSIFVGGYNQQNAIILKYSNESMAPLAVPVFDAIAPICSGDNVPTLSATSNNGISGTWSPATISNTASGTYTFTPNAGAHATTATLSVTINQPTTATVTETACETYTWAANGNTYTESGAYTNVTTNANGCPLTTTLNLTINQPTTATVTETACESYTFNGTTYTESGTYTQVTTNAAGCAHTTTLNLTINQPTTATVTETACETYTWAANGNTYTESGAYTNVTTNANGCPLTTTLNLTINQPTTATVTETACESYTFNGTTYTESGTYTQVTTNAAGCAHTTTLNLTINQPTTATVTETACETYTWAANGNTYTESGAYTNVTTNADGCPLTTTLNLTINQPTTATVTESACETYTWAANGNTYTESGAYTNVTTNANGCPLTTTLNLTINQPTTATVNAMACETYTWSANGTTYTDSGAYSFITTNAAGCTHTTTLDLTINNAAEITGDPEQSFEEGTTLSNVVVSPSNVVWYATFENAQQLQNPIAGSTVLTNGTVYYAVNFSAQGCPSAPFAVTVSVTLATDSFESANFGAYPNPTSGLITVQYSNKIDHMSILNVLGQQVLAKTINANQGQIDLSHLDAGTYFVKVTAGDSAKTLKVIKN